MTTGRINQVAIVGEGKTKKERRRTSFFWQTHTTQKTSLKVLLLCSQTNKQTQVGVFFVVDN